MEQSLDSRDYIILDLLQRDAKRPETELAQAVGLSVTGLRKRLERLQRLGVIDRRVALLNRNALGLDLLCFVEVCLDQRESRVAERFHDLVAELPEVLECHFLTGKEIGGYQHLLKILVRDHEELATLLTEKLTTSPGVLLTRTSIVLSESKATTSLPLNRTESSVDEAGVRQG